MNIPLTGGIWNDSSSKFSGLDGFMATDVVFLLFCHKVDRVYIKKFVLIVVLNCRGGGYFGGNSIKLVRGQ